MYVYYVRAPGGPVAGSEHDRAGMYAFVRFFISAVDETMRCDEDTTTAREEIDDLSIINKYNRLPYVQLDPDTERRYGFIDTSQINGGLWIQEDFTAPGKYWILSPDYFR